MTHTPFSVGVLRKEQLRIEETVKVIDTTIRSMEIRGNNDTTSLLTKKAIFKNALKDIEVAIRKLGGTNHV